MFSVDELTSFYRLYFSLYRIEHDISVDPESSFWQCVLAVQPGTDAQKSLLRKAFKGMEISVDRDGSLLIKSPICPIKAHPQIDKLFGGCEAFVSGLVGCDFQLQVVIAPNDDDYRADFTPEESREWLVSSKSVCELMVVGTINENGLEFSHIFHTCHQADINRDLTEDAAVLLNQWTQAYVGIAACAGLKADDSSLARLFDPELNKPRPQVYQYPCEDPLESARVLKISQEVELAEPREVQVNGNMVVSKLSCLELADILCSARYYKSFGLFGSDPS